ncbi:MAG: NUDIX hydrolase [Acidobacteriaceae bacterium]|nr:NUDIX hydrolase [Acidobacteriaceae bacterium]
MLLKTISSREVYRNPWCSVREDVTEREDGTRGIYGVMDKHGACIVVPLEHTLEGDFVWLVRQYRYTVGASFYELPQGGWETDDFVPEELARGELKEETGLSAERMTHLGDNWIAYGAIRQLHSVFLAEGLSAGETERDPEEFDMTVHRVSVQEFEAMILDGRVMDNCTIAAWCMYRLRKEAGK